MYRIKNYSFYFKMDSYYNITMNPLEFKREEVYDNLINKVRLRKGWSYEENGGKINRAWELDIEQLLKKLIILKKKYKRHSKIKCIEDIIDRRMRLCDGTINGYVKEFPTEILRFVLKEITKKEGELVEYVFSSKYQGIFSIIYKNKPVLKGKTTKKEEYAIKYIEILLKKRYNIYSKFFSWKKLLLFKDEFDFEFRTRITNIH